MERDNDDSTDGSDVPWLREMVDDDLLGLFSEEGEEVATAARDLVRRAPEDPSIAERLIETLRTSLEHQNDDTQASAWIALVLGEIADPAALPALFQALGGDDESLQEAAGDALLKIGPPAMDALMDELDEDPGPQFTGAAYHLLSAVGSLKDSGLLTRAMDFLSDRVATEAAKPAVESSLEPLFQASALLGDRRMLPEMDRVLRERFGGRNTAIRDSREMLSENASGSPVVHDALPWVEAYRWLFEEDPESSRVHRPQAKEEPSDEDALRKSGQEEQLSTLYWGLSATYEREGERPLDARRFMGRPDSAEDDLDAESSDDGASDEDDSDEGGSDKGGSEDDPAEDAAEDPGEDGEETEDESFK